MANKTLLEKLKGSVSDTLPIYGVSTLVAAYVAATGQQGYGGYLDVSEPVKLSLDKSYFTDVTGTENYGTEITYNGSDNFYVKKDSNISIATISISNKYAIKRFIAVISGSSFIHTALGINDETFQWATEMTLVNLGQGYVSENLHPANAFKRLVKLNRFAWQNYQAASDWVINDLAEAQIQYGRDYTTNPTIQLDLRTSNSLTKYFDGNTLQHIPTDTIFIVFKSGGYELHSNTADGTLLYDSLA